MTDEEIQERMDELIGQEIVDMEHTGYYYHPVILTLEDGTEIACNVRGFHLD